MDLRPRQRQSFSGFTQAEVEKMEHLHKESSEQSLNEEFYKKLARLFNRSSGRAGKPVVKWTEVQSWFEDRQRLGPSRETSRVATETAQIPEGGDDQDRRLEFEALSSKDGAWYDVETFLSHRLLSSGEVERRDQARYYDAHVIEIRRRLHDIRGCRCIFMIQYDHDKIEEEVRLRRLCCRPSMLVESEED
ncbi:protein SAWADEE HOMEODOMAIN HOMOLOG 1-like isoform X2 [Olea europaea var. sylvestris]|uniref:protein SAWADEE HOMEODOMAIN HOMOLOG 1-like isoform X2 n=1 Tax=Olea europaea var. sylvestris TaxID=158386 RepID=UPI000C1D5C98|nr:protein SAWADEE HOMEODOMAIN HOMOLOG 1-like isoform X2 [Olea europaea var. sylvestris]